MISDSSDDDHAVLVDEVSQQDTGPRSKHTNVWTNTGIKSHRYIITLIWSTIWILFSDVIFNKEVLMTKNFLTRILLIQFTKPLCIAFLLIRKIFNNSTLTRSVDIF